MFEQKKSKLKTGQIVKGGQAMITAVIFFLFISLTVILGVSAPVYSEVQLTRDIVISKESYYLSESGQEDVIYRLKSGMNVSNLESLTIGSDTVVTNMVNNSGTIIILSSATSSSLVRKISTELIVGVGIDFNYGLQAGEGGLYMKNTSSISGNVYSNGPITADNSPIIDGDAISAGPSGLIEDMEVTGDAYANTIDGSTIGGDAYYQTISSTVVSGIEYPGSSDQATTSFPIPNSTIEDWKTAAETGGVSTSCTIDSDISIGPIKFECAKLDIINDPVVTLDGPIWVEGDIEIQNTATVKINPSLGEISIPIIAHNTSDESGSGIITLKNSAFFDGPNNNFILLVSMNNDVENGGSTFAIEVQNSVDGDLLVYAPHGEINLKNSIDLKEVTGYKISTENSAEIIYDTGIASLLFSSGPGGGYDINKWKEVE
jgi:hypothetical protein